MADIGYLDDVAASRAGNDYKRALLDILAPTRAHTVLDIGCSPGTDLPALAALAGTAIGVDHDPTMVAEAHRRTADLPNVRVLTANAHALPLPDNSIDRARTDRVLQHVTSPSAALAELHRVLRPGGYATLAEPDWETLAVDPGALDTGRAFSRFVRTDVVRNAVVGRQLARLASEVGLEVRSVGARVPVFREFVEADRILGLTRNAERAVVAGRIGRGEAEEWLTALTTGPFLASVVLYVVVVGA
ncbi:methyltransferase domain-containing protein [Umezawaea endophytica]|uniref:Methyltransferase domain-containing protein n=1 Tax=Umezawaea endophytica TaxID=1654476 RepID=A0A9X2VLF3_9PSEU|nr:methyltransferase domain-containing protein [Umezawaea endophytica]MCS7478177.1 methyltransferase domain-containing protein [Umezawaea endophytica]